MGTHPTSHPSSAVEESERQILNQILNLPTSSPPTTSSTNQELALNLAADFQAVSNLLVGTSGQSWCDLAWVPNPGRTEYIVNAVTTNLDDFGPATGAPRRVIHHLQFLHQASALEWRDNLCRFRVFPLIVGRHYNISVFASVKGDQSAPHSAAFSYETTSGTNSCDSYSTGTSGLALRTDMAREGLKRGLSSDHENQRRIRPKVTAKPPSKPSGFVIRGSWNPKHAETVQCHHPACGQIFSTKGNKNRHDKLCQKSCVQTCVRSTVGQNGYANERCFWLRCPWGNCNHAMPISPASDAFGNYDVQAAIPDSFLDHLEEHMQQVTTKTQRNAKVSCQWRGCFKTTAMHAQSLSRHVRESHVGVGNRYRAGEGSQQSMPAKSRCTELKGALPYNVVTFKPEAAVELPNTQVASSKRDEYAAPPGGVVRLTEASAGHIASDLLETWNQVRVPQEQQPKQDPHEAGRQPQLIHPCYAQGHRRAKRPSLDWSKLNVHRPCGVSDGSPLLDDQFDFESFVDSMCDFAK